MKLIPLFLLWLLATPNLASAQIGPPTSIQEFGAYLIVFLNQTLIPFLFSLALLIFIYFVVRYFIINPENEQDRKTAKRYATYSIIAFVLMVSIWGIVNLFVGGIGLGQSEAVCPDSVPRGFCNLRQNLNLGSRGFGSATWGDDPYGEFGQTPANTPLIQEPKNNNPQFSDNNSIIAAAESSYYKAALDFTSEMADTMQDLVDSGKLSEASGIENIESTTALLLDLNTSDQEKITRINTFKTFVDENTYTETLSTLNDLRVVRGLEPIFLE